MDRKGKYRKKSSHEIEYMRSEDFLLSRLQSFLYDNKDIISYDRIENLDGLRKHFLSQNFRLVRYYRRSRWDRYERATIRDLRKFILTFIGIDDLPELTELICDALTLYENLTRTTTSSNHKKSLKRKLTKEEEEIEKTKWQKYWQEEREASPLRLHEEHLAQLNND